MVCSVVVNDASVDRMYVQHSLFYGHHLNIVFVHWIARRFEDTILPASEAAHHIHSCRLSRRLMFRSAAKDLSHTCEQPNLGTALVGI